MLEYAQSPECRAVLLARYFDDITKDTRPCGKCDNCQRPPAEKQLHDVSFQAWQIVRVVSEVHRRGGRVTLPALADLARGLGGAQFKVVERGGRAAGESARLDLDAVASGKVELSRENCERLIVQLLLGRYLGESYQATAYTVNVYMAPGPSAMRLARYPADQARSLRNTVQLLFLSRGMEMEPEGRGRKRAQSGTPARRGKAPIMVDMVDTVDLDSD